MHEFHFLRGKILLMEIIYDVLEYEVWYPFFKAFIVYISLRKSLSKCLLA